MKTNKKVQKNSVQKSEKENAVKVTALAIIPKPMTLLTPQDVPTATEVTEAPETATVSTVTEEAPQQATFKTPLATATAETDLDITTVHPNRNNHRKTFNDASLQELAESIREMGVLQAIAVRPRTEGGYEIIYGERRYRASLLAGAKTIKATIYNNVTDDEAEDMSLSENLQREQVRPTEEAKAFKRLLEKGRYDIYSLAGRFGRSEKYIYTRLKLNELYAPIGELLDNETITISVAEEISTYEANIQKDVYENHLKTDNKDDWSGYTLNLFKKYFEKYYTTELEQYKFDKTECKACVHNAANYNLFAEHNGCGHCTNCKCLETKNAAHVAKETEKLLKSDPKLVVARPYYGSRNDMALQKLDKKGHEIKELDYNVSAKEFPKAPEAPKKEQFTQAKEYEQAVETFERRNEEYARKVEELGRMKEEGRANGTRTLLRGDKQEGTRPRHYRDIAGKGQAFQTAFYRKDRCRHEKDCPRERLSRKPVHAVRKRYGLFRHAYPTAKEAFFAFWHQRPAFCIGRKTADENCSQTDGCTKDPHQTGLHQSLSL